LGLGIIIRISGYSVAEIFVIPTAMPDPKGTKKTRQMSFRLGNKGKDEEGKRKITLKFISKGD
jgi:hypothetical protein